MPCTAVPAVDNNGETPKSYHTSENVPLPDGASSTYRDREWRTRMEGEGYITIQNIRQSE